MKRPLPVLTLVFCLGIVFASQLHNGFCLPYYFSAALLILSFLSFKNGKLFGIFIFCLVFLLGMASLVNSDKPARDAAANYILSRAGASGRYIVKGSVLNNPLPAGGQTTFLFRVEEIQLNNLRHTCSGNILVRSKYTTDLDYGRELILSGNVYRSRFYRQDISALMSLKTPAQVIRLNKNKGAKIKAIAFWLKEKFQQVIYRYFSGTTAAIIEAMVLGEKRNIPSPVYDSMVKSGTVHILPRLYTEMPPVAL